MDLRLVLRDHPHQSVAEQGITHQDPYFRACWGPLLAPWTRHVVSEVAAAAADGDCTMTFDAFCTRLNPTPAHSTSVVKDREIRAKTVFGALQTATRSRLAFIQWPDPGRGVLGVFRQVPLLDEADLRRLNDPELFAHAGAVQDVNRRLVATGRHPLHLPGWLTERLGRGDPTARPPHPATAAIGQARLDALRLSQQHPAPGISL